MNNPASRVSCFSLSSVLWKEMPACPISAQEVLSSMWAILAILVSAGNLILHMVSQWGFHISPVPLLKGFGACVFVLAWSEWLPAVNRTLSAPARILFGFILLALGGMASTRIPFPLYPIPLGWGIAGAIKLALRWWMTFGWGAKAATILAAVFVSVWWSGHWGISDYFHPLFIPRIVTNGLNQDVAFHVSIVSMLDNFGRASTGLHGIPYLHYHWGSHWILTQLARILVLSPLETYQIAMPAIFWPLLGCGLMHVAGAVVGDRAGYISPVGVVLALGLLPLGLGGWLSPEKIDQFVVPNLLFSQSQVMALVFCTLSLASVYARVPMFRSFGSLDISTCRLAGIGVGLLVLGWLKISFLYAGLVGGAVVLNWRRLLRPKSKPAVMLAIGVGAAILYALTTPSPEAAATRRCLALDIIAQRVYLWPVLTLGWSLLGLCLFLVGVDIRTPAAFRMAGFWLVWPGLVCLPMLSSRVGGNALYFPDIVHHMGFAFFCGCLMVSNPKAGFARQFIRRATMLVLAGLAIYGLKIHVLESGLSWVAENVTVRTRLIGCEIPRRPFILNRVIVGAKRYWFGSVDYAAVVASHSAAPMLQWLQVLQSGSRESKKSTLLHVHDWDRIDWTLIDGDRLEFHGFLFPALTGYAAIRALPPLENRHSGWFGYDSYQNIVESFKEPLDHRQLIDEARQLGFRHVLCVSPPGEAGEP